uniref:Uncharacterized protein n=1 Tax=Molossus molossus TaxID=27622 RepID=A0A7J8CZM6_MOLMO|nr:hypothetical protein HJG59_009465 [Molossus molossus]
MYCLNAFKSLLFKEKLKQKYWYVTLRDCQCNKDNTNQHILHWTTVLSKVLGKCITDNLPDFSMSIRGPLTYAGFLITHIENASVFLLTPYVTGALMLCCILCFFCGTIPSRTKSTMIPICVYLLTLP